MTPPPPPNFPLSPCISNISKLLHLSHPALTPILEGYTDKTSDCREVIMKE